MYRNFEYYAPTRVVFGVDAELETAQLIRRAGGTRVLIVYGGGAPSAPVCLTGSSAR